MTVEDIALRAILGEHPLASRREDFAPSHAAALAVFRGDEMCAALVALAVAADDLDGSELELRACGAGRSSR